MCAMIHVLLFFAFRLKENNTKMGGSLLYSDDKCISFPNTESNLVNM